ncbi:hypothetical protein J5X98_07245 [Leptothermofonsia sichuanensis E412]|uniref:hypothetical protein n=1 Tax=Leptothermofonsia sichuanensis TaxID=2917832 RepID=UPI001CA667BC|nr:hypothetical protein [Leptothermofonsia sichuanensis]QZZ22178.1 hypothetical protein J5X98_07245 [Leptothermofonsia sichuanensis E412]
MSGRIIVKYSQLFTTDVIQESGFCTLKPWVFPVDLIHDSKVTAGLTPGMNYAVLLLLQRPEELSASFLSEAGWGDSSR